jgi:hypothetical protein
VNIAELPNLLERTYGEPVFRTNQGSQKNDSVRQSLLTADRFFREVMVTQKEPKTAKPPVERKPTALRSSPIAPLLERQSLGVEVASRRPPSCKDAQSDTKSISFALRRSNNLLWLTCFARLKNSAAQSTKKSF